MRFSNDKQRKAVFANMNKFSSAYSVADRMNMGEFSSGPDVRWIKSDKGVGFVKDEELMKDAQNYSPPGKKTYDIGTSGKSMKEQMDEFIEKNKRGVSLGQYAKDEFSKKKIEVESALQLAKNTYDKLWDNPNMSHSEAERATYGFLKDLLKEKDTAVKKWAADELERRRLDKKYEKEENDFTTYDYHNPDPDWNAPDGYVFDDNNEYSSNPKKKKMLKSQFGYEIEPGQATFVEVEVEK